MNKKGFTLIELLAVIVILAIIALITTPIVLNLINQSKEAANKRSVEAYAKAVEYAVAEYEYEHNGELPTFDDIKNNIEYSNSNVKCHVAINCDTKGSVELTGCQVGSYTNNYYKYSSTAGNKGAAVDEGVTEGPGNSSVEEVCSGGSSSSDNYAYFGRVYIDPIYDYETATDSYGDNECPDGYGYKNGTCYYHGDECEDGFQYVSENNEYGFGKCRGGFDFITENNTMHSYAYLKYELFNGEISDGTIPQACYYSDTYGGELCLVYGDFANNVTAIKTYFNVNESEIDEETGFYSKNNLECYFNEESAVCYFTSDCNCAYDSARVDASNNGFVETYDSSNNMYCTIQGHDYIHCF